MTALPPVRTLSTRRDLRLAETFGPTVQGEGPSTGRLALFVRLSGCNLDCAWCDTPYTWDWTGKNGTAYDRDTESHPVPVERVVAWAGQHPGMLVVVTGGEPLVQRSALTRLCTALNTAGHRVEVETNGTLKLPDFAAGVVYNVSPKLAHSGVDIDRAIRPDVLRQVAGRPDARLKFVCATPTDVRTAGALCDLYEINRGRAWVMPEGRTALEVHATLRNLADTAIAERLNLSPRLHVTCWEDERAR